MTNTVKVSVIIPTYNRALLVQEAIDSVLQQSFRDFEILVIDDGSTDDTEQALTRYASKIRYVKQENRGLNAARNRAIELAQGEYIALLDSDDRWRAFKLELEVSILDAYPDIGFVFGDFYILKPDGTRLANGLHKWFAHRPVWNDIFASSVKWDVKRSGDADDIALEVVPVYFGDIYYTSLFGPRVLPSASLFRKSMGQPWRLNEQDPHCGDWDFFSRLSRRHGAAFIDVETAFNGSHEDPTRLTRMDPRILIGKRLEMVNNLWKRDQDFCVDHQAEVDGELRSMCSHLLKLHLTAGETAAARRAAAQLDELGGARFGSEAFWYKALAFVPGSSRLVPQLDALRRKLGVS